MTAIARPDRDRPPVTAASLRIALEDAIRSRHAAADPPAVAETALSVVLPHLRALAGEVERLRGMVAEYVVTGDKRSDEGARHG